jgi:hypothetical protein
MSVALYNSSIIPTPWPRERPFQMKNFAADTYKEQNMICMDSYREIGGMRRRIEHEDSEIHGDLALRYSGFHKANRFIVVDLSCAAI